MDDEIILSFDENNRARPPRWYDVYLLANNTLKPPWWWVSWKARVESAIVSQVSVIADIEQLESIINFVIKSTLFRADLALRS